MSNRNKTLMLTPEEITMYSDQLLGYEEPLIPNNVYCFDVEETPPVLQPQSVDLLILDPPYNIGKDFGGKRMSMTRSQYTDWLLTTINQCFPYLKPTATVYLCGVWQMAIPIQTALERSGLRIRNRITWQREKGRGAESNWKNAHEDIYFCTVDKDYTFNVDAVKHRRPVIAPYKKDGQPKDWQETDSGNFRDTYPSNLWDDITVPFWSMSENTAHSTQKPEKLITKLILASSNPGDLVFDPFMGSGTTPVVAKKLGRNYIGIDRNQEYCMWAMKRLVVADDRIQGYHDGVFWPRNSK